MPFFSKREDNNDPILPEVIDCGDYTVTVKRTERKRSVSVEIRDAEVFIIVPKRLKARVIEEVLEEKHQWILRKLKVQQQREDIPPKKYEEGEVFAFMGRDLILTIEEDKQNRVLQRGDKLIMTHTGRQGRADPVARGRRLVREFYEKAALEVLNYKSKTLADRIQQKIKQVSVRDFKSQWGSCSRDNVLMYNWRIMMAPEEVIDYLVAHEVSHMVHHDHSPHFWGLVEEFDPHYKQHRHWLKMNGYRLVFN